MLHLSSRRVGKRRDVVRKRRQITGGDASVDSGEQRVDAKVLGFHRVEHGYLIRPGDPIPQRRPEPSVARHRREIKIGISVPAPARCRRVVKSMARADQG